MTSLVKHQTVDFDALYRRPTLTVPEAGKLLGIGRDSAYRAAAEGTLPTLRFNNRLVVPTAKLLAMLGIQPDEKLPATTPLRVVDDEDGPGAA